MDLFPEVFIGTLRQHYLLLFGIAGAVGLVTGVVGAWIGAYIGARRAIRNTDFQVKDTATAAQLSGIMNALDTISVEVERISEAQRFTSKVLSERVPSALPRTEQRNVTPH